MRNIFKEYYSHSEPERESIWQEATIVLDSSVLLHLFRTPVAARERLLLVLEALREQLWLPHHVGLEYHRNTATVQQEQKDRFRKVREELLKIKSDFKNKLDNLQLRKRHALIDADPLIGQIDSSIESFLEGLNQIELEQAELYQADTLESRLAELYSGRVGDRPAEDWLEDVQKEGKKRFDAAMPPGYLDANKGNKTHTPTFSHGGLYYQRKFGDLIVWKQILDELADRKSRWLVFVTDDLKEDWWERVGGQRIGPRPELVEELCRQTDTEGMFLFSPERFLAAAAEDLDIEIDEDALIQISTSVKQAETEEIAKAEPGFLDHLESAEIGLEDLAQIAEGLTAELDRVQKILSAGTARLKAASDFRLRKRVTNETAKELDASAATFSNGVDLFEETLRKIEPGIDYIIERIDALENETGTAPDAKEQLLALFSTIHGTKESARRFEGAMLDIPNATAALTNATRRMARSVEHYVEASGRVDRWLGHWQ